jgi:hypothetical protein
MMVKAGDKFNRLTAIQSSTKNGYWLFKCDCGNKHVAKLYEVRFGEIKSCGCLRQEKRVYGSVTPNDKFGLLTAVRHIGSLPSGGTRWMFKCDCGADYMGRLHSVQSGRVKSCGCRGIVPGRCTKCGQDKLRSEFRVHKGGRIEKQCDECRRVGHLKYIKERRKIDPAFRATIRRNEIKSRSNPNNRATIMFNALRAGANKRGITFNIAKADIEALAEKQNWKCAKTNIPLDLTHGCGQLPFGPTIDRIDSQIGYQFDNIQLVCYIYNVAKNRFTDADVLTFALALVDQQTII